MNQKSPKVATSCKQDIAMGFEDTALDQDAAVTEVASLALLVEFKQKLGQVARHLHDETSGGSARREEE